MKTTSATNNITIRSKRVWFTAAALLPLLSACSTADISGLLFGSSNNTQSISSSTTADAASPIEQANLNKAACGLFFGETVETASATSMETGAISLDRSPQENLLQAISYDISGSYENARKLYVWLTASPPDAKMNLDCGQGIKLSGSVNSLAQRRLVALDMNAPEFARSAEIDSVIASATVEPGPELPDPPKVERDRRFYQKGGVVEAAPEDSTTLVPRMNMDMSENTAKLTMVEKRAAKPADSVSSSNMVAPVASETVSAPTIKAVNVTAAQMQSPATSKAAPVDIMPATISGSEESTDHSGAVIASNSKPTAQGQLDIVDRAPDTSMIELPISSSPVSTTQATSPAPMTSKPVKAETPAQATEMMAPSGPYYAVQLAAYRSRGRAEGAWPKFQSSARGMLNSASHQVVTISIEGKGLFFRLLTGQYATNADATKACGQLKSVGVDCLIRRVTP